VTLSCKDFLLQPKKKKKKKVDDAVVACASRRLDSLFKGFLCQSRVGFRCTPEVVSECVYQTVPKSQHSFMPVVGDAAAYLVHHGPLDETVVTGK
jgi:hypothetical protein